MDAGRSPICVGSDRTPPSSDMDFVSLASIPVGSPCILGDARPSAIALL
jgi:hypothetical protein